MLAQGKENKTKRMDQMEHVVIWVQDPGLMGPNLLVSQVGKLRPREMKRLFRVTWWAPRSEG